jgi:hypothetical protein
MVRAPTGRPAAVARGRYPGTPGHRGRRRLVRRRLRGEPGEIPFAFDHIVLLSAPIETLIARLATRTNNSYGKAPEELRRFIDDVETVEPLLRRVANHEVRTTAPLNEVVTTILRLVDA